jgi:hypothetical protein
VIFRDLISNIRKSWNSWTGLKTGSH